MKRSALPPRGVVFDMDGLLLDSETLARRYFVAACRQVGWTPDLDVYHRCIGTTREVSERILRAGMGEDFPYERMAAHWSALYGAHLEQHAVPVKAGALALLRRLRALRIPAALATSTHRDHTETKLVRAGLRGYFDVMICGGETPRGKPHPDPYLAAAVGLDLPAASCWAFEDSDNGVRAAHAAGMMVFQVPDLVPPAASVRALGHAILESLADVPALD